MRGTRLFCRLLAALCPPDRQPLHLVVIAPPHARTMPSRGFKGVFSRFWQKCFFEILVPKSLKIAAVYATIKCNPVWNRLTGDPSLRRVERADDFTAECGLR